MAYTTENVSNDSVTETHVYDSTIKDRLVKFNNISIYYDANGCPIHYNDRNYFWTNGKLARVYCGAAQQPALLYADCKFTYDAYGRRLSKSYTYDPNPASTSDYSYTYNTKYNYDNSGRLIHEYCTEKYIGGNSVTRELTYLYDESGIVGVMYSKNGATATAYFYRRNLQGDVTAIYDSNGSKVGEYAYDAWGNCTILSGVANDLVKNNPIRYRGYYFDRETGLYYLNARYYNPQWRRFISPDSTDYLDPETPNGLNLYAYCNNDPINYVDPSGHSVDTIIDAVSVCFSFLDLLFNPTLENLGWLALDMFSLFVPLLTGSRLINAASKLDDIAYVGKGINRLDNIYDTVVLGNNMHRVMDRALEIGATFYHGYDPINALYALHQMDKVTDAMEYAAKLDNVRFIIDKVNAGYKFVLIGSDGRKLIDFLRSAYMMEIMVLYRLKIGNKLHRIWWMLNGLRRFYHE